MRSIITAMLAAAALLPAVAQAQSQPQDDRDRRELRQDGQPRQDDRQFRQDDRRGDDRDARRDMRDDRRGPDGNGPDRDRAYGRDDWRRWRDDHREIYAGRGWRAPFRYQAFRPGARIAPLYVGRQFVINDPWRYHLPPARPGASWVRHYNDVLLVDGRRGIVIDVLRGFYF